MASVPSVSTRTLIGTCHDLNRGAIDWSPLCGLVAYGSNNLVIVIDPVTLQIVQVLERHPSQVVRVAWAKAPTKKFAADRMTLASADTKGYIAIWNVKSGEVKSRLHDTVPEKRPVVVMKWMDGAVDNSAHLLASIHSPASLILWDTHTTQMIWKKNFDDPVMDFDIDPFSGSMIILRTTHSLLLSDFNIHSEPKRGSRKIFHFAGLNNGSPIRDSSSNGSNPSTPVGPKPFAFAKHFKNLVTGQDPQAKKDRRVTECFQVLFNRCFRNHIFVALPSEVLIFDLDIDKVVGSISFPSNGPDILAIAPTSQRDAIFILQESGVIGVHVRRKLFSTRPITDISKSNGKSSSVPSTPASVAFKLENVLQTKEGQLEIIYEPKAHTDPVVLKRGGTFLGMSLHPLMENKLVTLSSDGKVKFFKLTVPHRSKSKSGQPYISLEDMIPPSLSPLDCPDLRFESTGKHTCLCDPPFIIRMCPPLTVKNINEYKPLLAMGATNGHVTVLNMSTGSTEHELAVHSCPVRGIEWTGLDSFLSHASQRITGEAAAVSGRSIRNELMFTSLKDKKTTALRTDDEEINEETSAISMVRVSHLKQFFIVAFYNDPFELWDLKTLMRIRIMPKSSPNITAFEWSPLHNLKALKKKQLEEAMQKGEKEKHSDESEDKSTVEDDVLTPKEHFVFTDHDGQLYHFAVEGTVIKDGTKLKAEASLGKISCISWKSDYIVRGDEDGNLNIWDVRTRVARNVATNSGPIVKVRFAPGKGNTKLLVLHTACVTLWDIKVHEKLADLKQQVFDIDWAASDRPVLAMKDGCLKIVNIGLASNNSAISEFSFKEPVTCLPFLSKNSRENISILLRNQPWRDQYQLKFSEEDGFKPEEVEFIESQIRNLPEGLVEFMQKDDTTYSMRCLIASIITGDSFEADFWRVASVIFHDSPDTGLDIRFGFACDSEPLRQYHLERVQLHERFCSEDKKHQHSIVRQHLCLGQPDNALRLLMELNTTPTYVDNLKSCLISAIISAPKDTPQTITKTVATNLISEGKVWEGVELLCLIEMVNEACSYLQSCGKWDEAMWLGKCRLKREEVKSLTMKYCDHIATSPQDRKKHAILLKLSTGDVVATLDELIKNKEIDLAEHFLEACIEKKMLPDTSYAMDLSQKVRLAFARRLFEIGNKNAAYSMCDLVDENNTDNDDKGGALKLQLQNEAEQIDKKFVPSESDINVLMLSESD